MIIVLREFGRSSFVYGLVRGQLSDGSAPARAFA